MQRAALPANRHGLRRATFPVAGGCSGGLRVMMAIDAQGMIEARDLTKVFGERRAVDGVSLYVRAGEILVLLGPNGAGKTTTVRMLAGILRPSSGSARIAGLDVALYPEQVRQKVGVLTEHHGLYSRMRSNEYLDFFAALYGLKRDERRARAQELMHTLALEVDGDRWLAEYSKGMRQRISLVRALLHRPPVLMLDEPTSALDPASAHLVRDLLRELRAQGCAILACTHNLGEAEELADRIAILRHGRIVAQGRAQDLRLELAGLPQFEVRLAKGARRAARLVRQEAELVEVNAGSLRYRCASPGTQNPRLLQRLVEAGLPVVELREITPSLESVYLRAVAENGESGADDEAGE
jgi:ABC-2 type transport system ATP-binding protein